MLYAPNTVLLKQQTSFPQRFYFFIVCKNIYEKNMSKSDGK